MKMVYKTIVALLLILVLGYLTYRGYDHQWTGFQAYINNKGELVPPKKLWDWLQLLIIPTILAVGVWYLNRSQKNSDQQVETDKQRQQALDDYYDCMTDLLLKENLRDPNNCKESRSIARTRTLAVFRILDTNRKAQALQFLYESGLINKGRPIVQLVGADLNGAQLDGATLQSAELRGLYLTKAHLRGANLRDADLRGSNLTKADLTEACMINANLTQSILKGAKLRNADLTGTIGLNPQLSRIKGDHDG